MLYQALTIFPSRKGDIDISGQIYRIAQDMEEEE